MFIITATYKGTTPVQVLDVFTCGGIKLCTVRTIDGSLAFIGGDKWPRRCSETTCKVSEIKVNRLIVAAEMAGAA